MNIPPIYKIIYVQAFLISMTTHLTAYILFFLGYAVSEDLFFWVGRVLLWPREILVQMDFYFFNHMPLDSTLLEVVAQYLGYLGLLFVIRYIRKKKTAKLSP